MLVKDILSSGGNGGVKIHVKLLKHKYEQNITSNVNIEEDEYEKI